MGKQASSNKNLFQNEQKTWKNLLFLIGVPVGFNSSNDPWNPSLNQINPKTGFPQWEADYYEEYKCIDRLIILVAKNNYERSKQSKNKESVYIGGGYIIEFVNNIQFQINNPDKQRQILFLRDKQVKRPSGSDRFKANVFQIPISSNSTQRESQNSTNNTQIEQQNEVNQFELGEQFHKQNRQKFPSTKQIFDGLMIEVSIQLSQNSKLQETQEQIDLAISNHTQAWRFIFDCLDLDVNNQEEIKDKDLLNPDSNITKSILFLYSMETFLPYLLNLAERNQDASKIQSLGPFACALWRISGWAQQKRNQNIDSSAIVYRGAVLPLNVIEDYKMTKEKGIPLELKGFTSTTLSKDIAFRFMFTGLKKDHVPVLYQISNLFQDKLGYFKMDDECYSLFSYEEEILLITGSNATIVDISEKVHDNGLKYYLLQLER